MEKIGGRPPPEKKINISFINEALKTDESKTTFKGETLSQLRIIRNNLRSKYDTTKLWDRGKFIQRIKRLAFWLKYTYNALQVEGVSSEYAFFNELLGAAYCLSQLEDFGICVKVFAGLEAENREKFLASLREVFNRRMAECQGRECLECTCERSLNR